MDPLRWVAVGLWATGLAILLVVCVFCLVERWKEHRPRLSLPELERRSLKAEAECGLLFDKNGELRPGYCDPYNVRLHQRGRLSDPVYVGLNPELR